MPKMNIAQKTMMSDFNRRFFELLEKHWNPIESDQYWDCLTDDAMKLVEDFQSSNLATNNFVVNIVSAFMNSREEMLG